MWNQKCEYLGNKIDGIISADVTIDIKAEKVSDLLYDTAVRLRY